MDYPQSDIAFIAEIFIRAGFYISRCDVTDNAAESEHLELKKLAAALKRVELKSGNATISSAAQMACQNIKVPDIEDQEDLETGIKKSVGIFKAKDDAPGQAEFGKALMYVATSVARAYREETDHHEEEFMLGNVLDKISTYINGESDPREFANQNISPAEDAALTFMARALRT